MLQLKALKIDNFGPFRGHQVIAFPKESGVSVVYGENMRGKTSLLNAIRFAFFGKVLGRGMKPTSLHDVGNWEERELGNYGFHVTLDFTHEGHDYELTRSCNPRNGVTPATADDYVVDYFLKRDGDVLGPQQADAELKRILPEQISRFFLFDGELLQEYEDLLSNESDMGRRISDAIERILGVPVLTATRATLSRLKDKSERREAAAAQGDLKTREFGNQLTDLHEQRRVLSDDVTRHERELDALRSRKAGLEDAMKKRERVTALLDKRDTLDRFIRDGEGKKAAKEAQLRDAMSTAWSALIKNRARKADDELKKREDELQTTLQRADVLRHLKLDATATCPACLQGISPAARTKIEATLHEHDDAVEQRERDELANIRRKRAAIATHAGQSRADVLRMTWNAAEEADIELTNLKNERDEIDKQLEHVDEDALRKTKAEFEITIKQIDALEKGIAATRTKLEENKTDAERIQRRLDKLASGNLEADRKRRELYSDLYKLIDSGVAIYRDQLRKRVEADATRHFRALTTEPDYASLRINESYGLTVVHNDGVDIPVRSAGAEHVVALSLVGALQNNAPLRGPIIIDSPFGRLDHEHTKNIVRALPAMTEQIMLLVYEDELPPALAREELKGKLRSEWQLLRHSARHTEVVPRKD